MQTELSPSNALAIIAKRIIEDETYKRDWIDNVADVVRKHMDTDTSEVIAEKVIDKIFFGQFHDPNSLHPGYYWVKFKNGVRNTISDKFVPAWYAGHYFQIVGESEYFEERNFDRFIRMQPPELAIKQMAGDEKFNPGYR